MRREEIWPSDSRLLALTQRKRLAVPVHSHGPLGGRLLPILGRRGAQLEGRYSHVEGGAVGGAGSGLVAAGPYVRMVDSMLPLAYPYPYLCAVGIYSLPSAVGSSTFSLVTLVLAAESAPRHRCISIGPLSSGAVFSEQGDLGLKASVIFRPPLLPHTFNPSRLEYLTQPFLRLPVSLLFDFSLSTLLAPRHSANPSGHGSVSARIERSCPLHTVGT